MSKSERRIKAAVGNRGLPFLLLIALTGCEDAGSSNREPPLPKAKSLTADKPAAKSAAASAAGTTERNFDGAVFQVPSTWEEVPKKSDFIAAEFRVDGADGPARLTLSTAQGGVEANISRWKEQFFRGPDDPAPKESTLAVAGGKDATFVELFGSYQGMEPGATRKTGQAMLGVVIPLKIDGRDTNYFVKLTGPRETVSAARDEFVKFVETATFKD